MIVITLIAYLAKSMIFNPYTLYINGILVSQYDMKFEFGVFSLAPISYFLEKIILLKSIQMHINHILRNLQEHFLCTHVLLLIFSLRGTSLEK